MLHEIKKNIEKRRENLAFALDKRGDGLDPGLQHQIYGAILEIDRVLDIIGKYNKN